MSVKRLKISVEHLGRETHPRGMDTSIITIPTASLDSLRAALRRVNKAATRLSLPAADLRILADTMRELVAKTETHESANRDLGTVGGVDTRKRIVEVIDVELTLPELGRKSDAEWLVVGRVARVEGAGGQNEVFSDDVMVREQFLNTPITCEHCNTNRHRVRSLVCVSGVRAYARAMEKAAALANPPTEKAPEGRVQVTGTVKSFKTVDGQFGSVEKVLVELDTRAKVWVSVPGFFTDQVVGSVVTFVATFVRSERDEFFAFGSRPVAPKVKKIKAKKGDKVADPLAPGGEYVAK